MKFKKIFYIGAIALCAAVSYKIVRAAPGVSVEFATNVDKLMLDRNQILDATGTVRIQVGAENNVTGNQTTTGSQVIGSSLTVQGVSSVLSGKVFLGSATVAQSSAIVAGSSLGTLFTATLGGGVNAVEGSALVAASTASSNIIVAVSPASALTTSCVGFAAAAASTGSVVNFYSNGIANVFAIGTVVPGDQLYISSAPGTVNAIAFTTGPVVAISMQAHSNLFGGLIKAKLK